MQLTVRQVSALLNVSESTATRWVKQRGLPAQQVAGQIHRIMEQAQNLDRGVLFPCDSEYHEVPALAASTCNVE